MRKQFLLITSGLLFCSGLSAQDNDTVKMYNLNDVVVSATKNERKVLDIPVRVKSIPARSINANNIFSAEDILKNMSGFFVTRNLGIFDKHASVVGRGVGKEQARTLIMVDGVPINKTSTGSANFSMINLATIDRVEVVKGPNSNIYGGNAMGGTINYITNAALEGFRGSAQVEFANYNTLSTRASMTLRKGQVYGGINGFVRKSDGYNPSTKRDSTTINMNLNEKSIGGVLGCYINDNNRVEFNMSSTDAIRGKGERLYAKGGILDGVNHYTNNNYRLSYNGKNSTSDWNFTTFLSTENYVENKWKGSDIYDVDADRKDYGAWLSYNYNGIRNNCIGAGLEYKGGVVEGKDVYRTVSDVVINKGRSNSGSFYLQDEISFLDGRITAIPSLRADFVKMDDGGFFIEGGTSVTNYLSPYTGSLDNSTWSSLSPKLAIQYKFDNMGRVYFSGSRGFRPGSLEDMTRTGSISGGVILANTSLKPEHINTFEVGSDVTLAKSLIISPSLYYSLGTDFHYAVNTGKTIKIGNKNKPLLSLQNIGKVEIYGGEIDLNYSPVNGLDLFANYTYTHSKIVDYKVDEKVGNVNLDGKYLTYTPQHMFHAGATWRNNILSVNAVYSHISSQFMDSANSPDTDKYVNNIPSYGIFDLKVWHTFGSGFTVSMGVNNMFDIQYLDSSSNRSLGRYVYTQLNIDLSTLGL